MAGIEEELALDISEALRDIDKIEEALTAAVATFSESMVDAIQGAASTPVEVEIDNTDTSDVTESIDAAIAESTTPVEVDADASSVTDEIEQAVEGADVTVEAEVDTSAAEAALEGLGDTAGQQAEGVGNLSGSFDSLSSSAALSTGSLAGVGSALGKTSPAAAGAAAGLVAVAGVANELFNAAVESEAAQQRYNNTLGQYGEQVDNITVGGLSTNIEELALAVGSSDESMKNAAASIFQLGESSGHAGPEVAETTKNILALSSRAVALNPALGDAGETAEGLRNSLARGGRALNQFGLSITSADITLRALKDTGKTSAAELTVYEKSAAGAAIATEQLGNRLSTDIAKGAANPVLQLRTLREEFGNALETFGQPLVVPIIELLRRSQPLFLQVADAFGDLAMALIPIVTNLLPIASAAIATLAAALGLLNPVLGALGDILGSISPELLEAVGVFVALNFGIIPLITTVVSLAKTLPLVGRAFTAMVAAMEAGAGPIGWIALAATGAFLAFQHFTQGNDEAEKASSELSSQLNETTEGFDAVREAAVKKQIEDKNQKDDIDSLGISYGELTDVLSDNSDGYAGLHDAIQEGVEQGGKQANVNLGLIKSFDEMATQIQDSAEKSLGAQVAFGNLTQAQVDAAEAANTNEDGTINYAAALDDLEPKINKAKEAEAKKAAEEEKAATKAQSLADATASVADAMQAQLGPLDVGSTTMNALAGTSDELGAAFLRGGGSADSYARTIKATGLQFEELSKFQEGLKAQVDELAQSYQQGLVGIDEAVGSISESIDEKGVKTQTSFAEFMRTFEEGVTRSENFLATIDQLRAAGAGDIAKSFLEAGVVSDKAAKELLAKGPEMIAAEEAKFDAIAQRQDDSNKKTREWAAEDIAIKLEAAIQASRIDLEADKAAKALSEGKKVDFANLVSSISSSASNLEPALKTAGGNSVQALMDGLVSKDPTEAGKTVGKKAKGGIEEGGKGTYDSGVNMVNGLIAGLESKSTTSILSIASKGLGKKVVGWINEGAKSTSPSKLAMQSGQFIVQGLVVGLSQTDELEAAASAAADVMLAPFASLAPATPGVTSAARIRPMTSALPVATIGATAAVPGGRNLNVTVNAKTADLNEAQLTEHIRRSELLTPVR